MDTMKVNQKQKEYYLEQGYWGHETLLDRFLRTVERFPDREYVVDDRGNRHPPHSPQWSKPLDSQHDLTPQTPPQKGASILIHPLQLTACFLPHESQHTPHLD